MCSPRTSRRGHRIVRTRADLGRGAVHGARASGQRRRRARFPRGLPGLRSRSRRMPPAWGEGPALHAHQIVLEVLSETGGFGLLLWLAGVALAWRAWRFADEAARERARPAMLALAVDGVPVQHPPGVLFDVLGRADACCWRRCTPAACWRVRPITRTETSCWGGKWQRRRSGLLARRSRLLARRSRAACTQIKTAPDQFQAAHEQIKNCSRSGQNCARPVPSCSHAGSSCSRAGQTCSRPGQSCNDGEKSGNDAGWTCARLTLRDSVDESSDAGPGEAPGRVDCYASAQDAARGRPEPCPRAGA